MKKTLVLSLMAMILLTACKKDPPEASLKNKWTIENSVAKEYVNGTITNTTTIPGGGATLDFQDNGNVVITVPGYPAESYPYTMKPDSKVEFDGDIYEIRNLTNSNVTLYLRYDYSPGEYDEYFLNLKK